MSWPVYLDGVAVSAETITPTHRFVGTFRSPTPPSPGGAAIIVCPCGRHLHSSESTHEHWRLGHFDVPQYLSPVEAP